MKNFDYFKLKPIDNTLFQFLISNSENLDVNAIPELHQVSRLHGLEGVFLAKLISSDLINDKEGLVKTLREYRLVQTFIYTRRLEVLNDLCNSDMEFVVMKGFAISHMYYDDYLLRPYSDIDIFIDRDIYFDFKSLFSKMGFDYATGWDTEPLIRQVALSKKLGSSLCLEFDLHTAFSSDFCLNELFNYDLFKNNSQSMYIAELDKYIYIPQNHLTLLHSMVHFFSHIQKGNLVKLVWLYDIAIIIESLSKDDITSFDIFVKSLRMGEFVFQVLEILTELLTNNSVNELKSRFNNLDHGQDKGLYLLSPKTGFFFLTNNIKNLRNLKDLINFVRYTIFPPKVAIEKKYDIKIDSIFVLMYFYFKRALFSLKRYSGKNYEVKK